MARADVWVLGLLLVGLAGGCGPSRSSEPTGEGASTAGGEQEEEEELEDAGPEPVCNLAETPIAEYRLPRIPPEFDLLDAAIREPFDMASAVLERRAPAPPEELSMEAVQAWSSGPFAAWIVETRAAMRAAEERLEGLSDRAEAVRVVSSTLAALMHLHLASQALTAPMPAEIASDPELRGIFLSALREGVAPVLEAAADRAEYCALVAAQQPEQLERWRLFCFALIGSTVVEDHVVGALIRARSAEASTPEFIERTYGTPSPDAHIAAGTPVVEGQLPVDVVQSYLDSQQRPLLACYQRGLSTDPNLHGQLGLRFRVGRNGATSAVTVTGSTISNEPLTQCLVAAVDAMTFPAPASGEATVSIALNLNMMGRGR